MPGKIKVTKEMIIDAAFEIARKMGAENINARTVSEMLNCSTQPVMYHFQTIEELKKAVYEKADIYHSEYLMRITGDKNDVMQGIGLNYIRFAIHESHLFRFLFQSNFFNGSTMLELINDEALSPVLEVMKDATSLDIEQTKRVFLTVFLFVHGYASIIANNALKYNEEQITEHLNNAYLGAILQEKEKMKKINKN